jgi:hypothetical protein
MELQRLSEYLLPSQVLWLGARERISVRASPRNGFAASAMIECDAA